MKQKVLFICTNNSARSQIAEGFLNMLYKDNYEALGKMLAPNIKPLEAKKAIQNLTALKLIKKDKRGYYKPTVQHVSTGPEWKSLAITNFQLASTKLAGEAINRFPRPCIDFSTMTLSISSKNLKAFKEKISLLRRELAEEEAPVSETDSVYQFNFHMFPMTRLPR